MPPSLKLPDSLSVTAIFFALVLCVVELSSVGVSLSLPLSLSESLCLCLSLSLSLSQFPSLPPSPSFRLPLLLLSLSLRPCQRFCFSVILFLFCCLCPCNSASESVFAFVFAFAFVFVFVCLSVRHSVCPTPSESHYLPICRSLFSHCPCFCPLLWYCIRIPNPITFSNNNGRLFRLDSMELFWLVFFFDFLNCLELANLQKMPCTVYIEITNDYWTLRVF